MSDSRLVRGYIYISPFCKTKLTQNTFLFSDEEVHDFPNKDIFLETSHENTCHIWQSFSESIDVPAFLNNEDLRIPAQSVVPDLDFISCL